MQLSRPLLINLEHVPLQKSPKIHTAMDSDKDISLLTAFQYEWTECGVITA